jgi:Ca-dependent carbohydrate-binding module xylan-binding
MFRTFPIGWRAAARVALAAATLAVLLPAQAARADTDAVATVAGETLTSAKGVGIVSDAAAEGGKALAIWSDAMAQGETSLAGPAGSVQVRLRGVQCAGAPTAQVTLDGSPLFSYDVSSTAYVKVAVKRTVSAGTHTIAVGLVNDYRTSTTCDRALAVDTVSFLASSTPAAGTVAGVTSGVEPVPVPAVLAWAPPALTAPTTIKVAQGDQWYTLDKTKDYVVELPAEVHLGQVIVSGGRNVVIRGGAIGLPWTSTKNTALGIRNNVGTVHVEGVLFDGSSGREMDAINISAPGSIVQVENVRATGLFGSLDANHSDIIQPYGGVTALRVDRLSGDSNFQGLFTRPEAGPIGSVDVRNVDMSFNDATATSGGGYLLWMTTSCAMAPTQLTNVYVRGRATTLLGSSVWPSSHDGSCPAKIVNGTALWPNLPVTGGVIGGVPQAGPFVPAGRAGPAYVSPGYAAQP